MAVLRQNPARILISVIQHYVDGAGGSSRLAYDQALYLRDRGHEVWMLASARTDDAPEHEYKDGFHFLRYRCQKSTLTLRPMLSCKRAISNILKRHAPGNFDIVHGHGTLQHLAVCEYVGGSARKCFSVHSPVVDEIRANLRGNGMKAYTRHVLGTPLLRRAERECLRQSDWVNAFSNFTATRMKHHHGALADRIEVLPGWGDMNRFRIIADRSTAKAQLGWRTDIPVLFTLRRLERRMGIDNLLNAVSMLSKEGIQIQMIIGGTGTIRNELQWLAQTLGLQDTVQFVGFVPDEVLPLMYGACDAFVLPTAALECFGIIAVEALASGRPVLATPVAAIPEIINRVEPTWLARSETPQAIRDLLRDFINRRLPMHDPNRLRQIAQSSWDKNRQLDVFCDRVFGNTNSIASAGAQ